MQGRGPAQGAHPAPFVRPLTLPDPSGIQPQQVAHRPFLGLCWGGEEGLFPRERGEAVQGPGPAPWERPQPSGVVRVGRQRGEGEGRRRGGAPAGRGDLFPPVLRQEGAPLPRGQLGTDQEDERVVEDSAVGGLPGVAPGDDLPLGREVRRRGEGAGEGEEPAEVFLALLQEERQPRLEVARSVPRLHQVAPPPVGGQGRLPRVRGREDLVGGGAEPLESKLEDGGMARGTGRVAPPPVGGAPREDPGVAGGRGGVWARREGHPPHHPLHVGQGGVPQRLGDVVVVVGVPGPTAPVGDLPRDPYDPFELFGPAGGRGEEVVESTPPSAGTRPRVALDAGVRCPGQPSEEAPVFRVLEHHPVQRDGARPLPWPLRRLEGDHVEERQPLAVGPRDRGLAGRTPTGERLLFLFWRQGRRGRRGVPALFVVASGRGVGTLRVPPGTGLGHAQPLFHLSQTAVPQRGEDPVIGL